MLDSAKSKWRSGGDTIVCRPLYGQLTSFQPTAKVLMMSNFRPLADGSDNALWYRLVLVPFTLSFVENPGLAHERQRDKDLQSKLTTEASGILAWLYRGFRVWRREGLNPPDRIKAATNDFRNENDSISQFILNQCLVMPGVRVKAGELFEGYRTFCEAEFLTPENQTSFFRNIKTRFKTERKTNARWYIDIALKAND